jgi:hypothetical protein
MTSREPLPASKFVLQTFNLLDTTIARDLSRIASNLTDIRATPLPADYYDKYISEQTTQQLDYARYEVSKTQMETFKRIAVSFGVSGSYGVYSGSVQCRYSSEQFRSATAFTSSSVGAINLGTAGYKGPVDHSMLHLLRPAFVSDLERITTLEQAKQFVSTYGTHLALAWNLGGCFSIQIEAATSSYQDKASVEAKATAAYQAVANIKASVSAAAELKTSGSQYNLTESIFTAGGDAQLASKIDVATGAGLNEWLDSCTTKTTYGLDKMISLADLATRTGYASQGKLLQKYFDLAMLAFSLQNPTVFSAETALVPGTSTDVQAVADEDFKIISGGAAVAQNVSSWLTNCYPLVAGGAVNSWMAGSHDVSSPADPSNHLTCYAIAVYDPGQWLDVQVQSATGSNANPGPDGATVAVDASHVLTGGGCQTQVVSGSAVKFIECSYPSAVTSWAGRTHDYELGANVTSTFYAVGVASDELTIRAQVVPSPGPSPQEHGNQSAVLGNGLKVAGGGVQLVNQGGMGNLVQQNYPSADNTWTEYNKDTDGHASLADSTAYAIGMTATINGLTAQPDFLLMTPAKVV